MNAKNWQAPVDEGNDGKEGRIKNRACTALSKRQKSLEHPSKSKDQNKHRQPGSNHSSPDANKGSICSAQGRYWKWKAGRRLECFSPIPHVYDEEAQAPRKQWGSCHSSLLRNMRDFEARVHNKQYDVLSTWCTMVS